MKSFFWAIVLCAAVTPWRLYGDAGVLLPSGENQPDVSVLSLNEMDITVRIDNGDARVFVEEIFTNHSARVEEGTYLFALPTHAALSDFAVWDGPTRIPAVMLERKRAEDIYNALKQQAIDPGLLEMGENGGSGSEAARTINLFSAKITPIPAYGTKRLEIEYHESLPVEHLKSYFAIPLHPDVYHVLTAEHLAIHFQLDSALAIHNFQLGTSIYPLQFVANGPHSVEGSYEGQNVNLTDDFSVTYELDPAGADSLRVLAYRNPKPQEPSPTEVAPVRQASEPGFFETEAFLGSATQAAPNAGNIAAGAPRTIIFLFDTSLSMQWDKLEQSYGVLERILYSLKPTDRFNLLLFNSEVSRYQPVPVSADRAAIANALNFVRASRLRGGTDLEEALKQGLAQCASTGGGPADLILLTDGGATRGTIQNGQLAAWYAARWKKLPKAQRPRTYIFAVGDDANVPLLQMLAQNDGVLEPVLSTEPLDFKLDSFLSKLSQNPVDQLRMDATPASGVDLIYPLQDKAFPGSVAAWVGQYHQAARGVQFDVKGVRNGEPFALRATADLPDEAPDHPQIPRLWARARVDALLDKIQREGEDAATIDEIISLSRRYKFVTPYTSFLAVPRALLRPRVIQPGDPVLRVKTDPSIVSVIALFPFGLVQNLRYLSQENIWETRFLAPADLRDGTYNVRLVLRDRLGHTYRESKSFVILSTPPVVAVRLDRKQFHRGETVALKVSASESTRTLTARLEGTAPIFLRWDSQVKANTGAIAIPSDLPAGSYRLSVTAEDIAHNTGSQEVQIEVLP